MLFIRFDNKISYCTTSTSFSVLMCMVFFSDCCFYLYIAVSEHLFNLMYFQTLGMLLKKIKASSSVIKVLMQCTLQTIT